MAIKVKRVDRPRPGELDRAASGYIGTKQEQDWWLYHVLRIAHVALLWLCQENVWALILNLHSIDQMSRQKKSVDVVVIEYLLLLTNT